MLGISLPQPARNFVPNCMTSVGSASGYENVGSASASRREYRASGTAAQVMSKNSEAWKLVPFAGDVNDGLPGAAPVPVMVKLLAADQPESIEPTVPPTVCDAFTRQK